MSLWSRFDNNSSNDNWFKSNSTFGPAAIPFSFIRLLGLLFFYFSSYFTKPSNKPGPCYDVCNFNIQKRSHGLFAYTPSRAWELCPTEIRNLLLIWIRVTFIPCHANDPAPNSKMSIMLNDKQIYAPDLHNKFELNRINVWFNAWSIDVHLIAGHTQFYASNLRVCFLFIATSDISDDDDIKYTHNKHTWTHTAQFEWHII